MIVWTAKKLSLGGRILVSNQVIAASIWYLASCLDISNTAVKQVRAMLRNYIWGGRTAGQPRAKVAWQQAILPLDKGGLKILDPGLQASALLVKLLVRGLTPGWEPWKDFILHRVEGCQQSKGGQWHKNSQWLMTADKLVNQNSAFWMGTWQSWKGIRQGIKQNPPQHWAEIVRQPLFGNNLIRDRQGYMLGMAKRGKLRNWAQKGIVKTLDVWYDRARTWRSARDLNTTLKTPKIESQRSEVIESIPWSLGAYPSRYYPGEWLRDISVLPSPRIVQIHSIRGRELWGWSYFTRPDSDLIYKIGEEPEEISATALVWARVATKIGPRAKVSNFNPKENPPDGSTVWAVGERGVSDLDWDPKDWSWSRVDRMPEVNFCEYTTKRGYQIGLSLHGKKAWLDEELHSRGYSERDRGKALKSIWHPWRPRKIAAFLWLIINKGLPTGSWRGKLGMPSECQVCAERPIETTEHCFQTCEEVRRAWELFRQLRLKANLTREPGNWEETLMGKALSTTRQHYAEEAPWGAEKAFSINSNTPWDLLRTNILWNIWVQRCRHNFTNEIFSLSSALYTAWQNTIQIGMAAWFEVTKFRHVRGQQKQNQLEETFTNIWTAGEIFSTKRQNSMVWKFTPDDTFLPKGMAREAMLRRELRRRRNQQSGPQDSGLPFTQTASPTSPTQVSDPEGEPDPIESRQRRGDDSPQPNPETSSNNKSEDEGFDNLRALLELTDLT